MSPHGSAAGSGETLRHLIFATDAWADRAILGQPMPYHRRDWPAMRRPDWRIVVHWPA